jgi:hypothetical protein
VFVYVLTVRAPVDGVALLHRVVAVQAAFERQVFKPGLMFKGEGLKPPGYQAPFSCGSGGVNVHRGPHGVARVSPEVAHVPEPVVVLAPALAELRRRAVAVQVAFERQRLGNQVFSLDRFNG